MDFSLHRCASGEGEELLEEQQEPGILEAADTLACVLTDAPELQAYLRLGRAVRLNSEIGRINSRLNGYPLDNCADLPDSPGALEELRESLPLIQEYRQAEARLRALFVEVNLAISAAAGVSFAVNAKPSGCA